MGGCHRARGGAVGLVAVTIIAVIPAKAGIQCRNWIPACAGMTPVSDPRERFSACHCDPACDPFVVVLVVGLAGWAPLSRTFPQGSAGF
jgi:hypothetical protein